MKRRAYWPIKAAGIPRGNQAACGSAEKGPLSGLMAWSEDFCKGLSQKALAEDFRIQTLGSPGSKLVTCGSTSLAPLSREAPWWPLTLAEKGPPCVVSTQDTAQPTAQAQQTAVQ